ncbi:transcription factor IIIC subunit delta N-term-domain-containing protein [Fennellomyces sp. T-0311]|nr:transcription factor IIIC subunit delta N-term-domain-containing protein [Fennellomyces sp. T-0311]
MEYRPGISIQGRPFFYGALQWSEDDQIALCLRNAVHIIAPAFVDLRSEEESHVHIGLKELRKGNPNAPSESTVEDKPVQPSVLIDESYRCARWSPTGLSNLNGCILAVVTTQHQVTLYSSPGPGEYFTTCLDMTPLVKEHVLGTKDEFTTTEELDRFQTLHCAWSRRIVPDALAEKPALIALSNKAGEITLWSYHHIPGSQFCTSFVPHQSFVNLLEWSQWRTNGTTYTAYLFSACVDGTVAVSSVEVDIAGDNDGGTAIQSVIVSVCKTWFTSDPANVSILSTWDDLKSGGRAIKVALCKNARVEIASLILDEDNDITEHWSQYYLEYSTMGLSGAKWSPDGSQLQLYTYDCQAIVLDIDNHAKSAVNEEKTAQTNQRILNKVNQQWVLEQAKMDRETVATSHPVVPKILSVDYSITGLYSVILFTIRPELDSNYYGTNNMDVCFTAFVLHGERQDDKIVKRICDTMEAYQKDPDFLLTLPIQALLHESFQYVVDEDADTAMLQLLETLDRLMSQDKSSSGTLARKVYCDERATAARIVLRAQIDLKEYELPEESMHKLVVLSRKAKSFLQQQFAANTLKHISDLPDERLKKFNDDVMVTLLLCDRILASAEPIDFALEQVRMLSQRLCSLSEAFQGELDKAVILLNNEELQEPLPGREKCPSCEQLLTIDSGQLAVCPSFHIWGCCSLTNRAFASDRLRVCMLCGEKSLAPGSHPPDSLTEFILLECDKCILCGSTVYVP